MSSNSNRRVSRNHKARQGVLINAVYNTKRKAHFGTLTRNGWFSAAPDDASVHRSIRTNNPGAMNDTKWQRGRSGYVGRTAPDAAGNKTTIYRTPEEGVAAWRYLLTDIYGFGSEGGFTVIDAARRYAGRDADLAAISAYLKGWKKWSGGALSRDTRVSLRRPSDLMVFAQAVFAHEADVRSPLSEEQIRAGLQLF
jgi:hypothetical protein